MVNEMSSRERIIAAIEKRNPDRVPIDVGGSLVTTIIDEPYQKLKELLGIECETTHILKKSGSVIIDEAVAERLNSDTRPLVLGSPDYWEDIVNDDGSFLDEYHVLWKKASIGHFAPVDYPIKNPTRSDLDDYSWPDPFDPGRIRGLRDKAKKLNQETDYAVLLSLPPGFVHLSQYLRGFENWLLDIVLYPDFFADLLDRTVDYWVQLVEVILKEVEPYVDVVVLADDVAFQDAPMLDVERYRKLIKPCHQRMINCIREMSRAKILYHTDGVILPYMEDFIEIGFDALNPIQVNCPGMDNTRELKLKYGDKLCFWGGIDTSSVLSNGSTADVRSEVRRRIQDLSADGGYVLAAVHNIQEDVPPENILAMVDAAMEFGGSI